MMMKSAKKIQFSLLCSFISIGIYIYLSFEYYQLKFGMSHNKSFCEINEIFDCAAVSASPYSTLFGIPLSLWGFSLQLALFFMLFAFYFYLVDLRERLGRFCFYFSSLAALSSIVMGFIAVFFMDVYCLFCWILYFLSFVQWELLRRVQKSFELKEGHSRFKECLDFIRSKKGFLSLFFVPVLAFFIHKSWVKSFGFSNTEVLIQGYLKEWKSDEFFSLDAKPSLEKGPVRDQAELVISEFADFLCSHCKNASKKLMAFSKAYPKVRFEFYNFPLDGSCNKEVSYKSGLSCRLAKAIHCSEKWNQGWNLHNEVFLKQSDLKRKSLEELDVFLKDLSLRFHFPLKEALDCMESQKTQELFEKQIELAKKVGVRGTPSFFANGKRISSAQWIPLLEAVRKESIKSALK